MSSRFRHFLLRALFTTVGVALAARFVDGIRYDDTPSLVTAAVLLVLLNAVLRPLLIGMALPLVVLSFGAGILLINSLLFLLVEFLVPGFHVDGFVDALLGSILVSFFGLFALFFTGSGLSHTKKAPPKGPSRRQKDDDDVIDI